MGGVWSRLCQAFKVLRGEPTVAGDDTASTREIDDPHVQPPQPVQQISGHAQVQANYGQAIGQISGGSVFYLAQTILSSDPDKAYLDDLARYLKRFAHSLNRMPLLHAVAPKLAQRGHEIGLPHIYMMLATTHLPGVLLASVDQKQIGAYFARDVESNLPQALASGAWRTMLTAAYHPDEVLPDQAVVEVIADMAHSGRWWLNRALLATEAVVRHRRLVLLGDPGSGKSTFMRHLAWTMACHMLGQPMNELALPPLLQHKLPAILPLRTLATLLTQEPNALAAVKRGLVEAMQTHYAGAASLEQLLGLALDKGAVALFFDGLDEVPMQGEPGQWASRADTFAAVREVAQIYDTLPVVVTCRVRAYEPFRQAGGGGWQDVYVFAHLTLQEHCAGCHIVGSSNPVALVMQHRADDRWREPIFLGLGLAPPADLDDVFDALLDCQEYQQNTVKLPQRRYRDLILAAELGIDRTWSSLQTEPRFKARQHKDALRTGLADLLNDTAQPLPVNERVRAGFLLGDLGDPRFPITVAQWQAAAQQALAGDPSGYFCTVDAGSYIIGSGDDDPHADDSEKPRHT